VPPLTHTATVNGVEAAPVSVSPLPCPATVINPALVPGLAHVQYAAQRALLHDAAGTRSTHSLHTELLYSLSGSRNISDALRRFGLDPAGKAVLVAAFNPSPAAWEELLLDVSGTVSGGRVWGCGGGCGGRAGSLPSLSRRRCLATGRLAVAVAPPHSPTPSPQRTQLSSLRGLADLQRVKKHFNVSDAELSVSNLVDAVVSKLATAKEC